MKFPSPFYPHSPVQGSLRFLSNRPWASTLSTLELFLLLAPQKWALSGWCHHFSAAGKLYCSCLPQLEWEVGGTAGWCVLVGHNDLTPSCEHDRLVGSRLLPLYLLTG